MMMWWGNAGCGPSLPWSQVASSLHWPIVTLVTMLVTGHPAVNGHSLISLNFSRRSDLARGKWQQQWLPVTRPGMSARNPRNQFLFWLWNSCDCIDDINIRRERGVCVGMWGETLWFITSAFMGWVPEWWQEGHDPCLWLVKADHVTWRLVSDWASPVRCHQLYEAR